MMVTLLAVGLLRSVTVADPQPPLLLLSTNVLFLVATDMGNFTISAGTIGSWGLVLLPADMAS